jgi:hypothetical protein
MTASQHTGKESQARIVPSSLDEGSKKLPTPEFPHRKKVLYRTKIDLSR